MNIIKLSRPRFWLYLGGTYLVGFTAGASSLSSFDYSFFLHLIYFIFFANVFLYGINDYFDRDTDKYNPKKGGKEHKLRNPELHALRMWLIGTVVLGLLLLLVNSFVGGVLLVLFLLLSAGYSAPPRFKALPFLDFLSNVLYVVPGFLGYYQSAGVLPSWPVVIAAWLWVGAMHWFSAIPDIVADAKAGLHTTAMLFGSRWSLVLTSLLWGGCALIVSFQVWWGVFFFVYLLIPLVTLVARLDVTKVYWYFPYLNAVMGFALFIIAFGGVFA